MSGAVANRRMFASSRHRPIQSLRESALASPVENVVMRRYPSSTLWPAKPSRSCHNGRGHEDSAILDQTFSALGFMPVSVNAVNHSVFGHSNLLTKALTASCFLMLTPQILRFFGLDSVLFCFFDVYPPTLHVCLWRPGP